MQISSSVSSRYYTSYQTNRSVKYRTGSSQTEDGKKEVINDSEILRTGYQKVPQDWLQLMGMVIALD